MGWVSYFEDIWEQKADAICAKYVGLKGPAGKPLVAMSAKLAAGYSRLAAHISNTTPAISNTHNQEEWRRLSHEMDAIADDIRSLNARTLMQTGKDVLCEADSLSQRLQSVLMHARSVHAHLETQLKPIVLELSGIRKQKSESGVCEDVVPTPERRIELQAQSLYDGWDALDRQIEDLEHRDCDLRIRLAGETQKRMMDGPCMRVRNKHGK